MSQQANYYLPLIRLLLNLIIYFSYVFCELMRVTYSSGEADIVSPSGNSLLPPRNASVLEVRCLWEKERQEKRRRG